MCHVYIFHNLLCSKLYNGKFIVFSLWQFKKNFVTIECTYPLLKYNYFIIGRALQTLTCLYDIIWYFIIKSKVLQYCMFPYAPLCFAMHSEVDLTFYWTFFVITNVMIFNNHLSINSHHPTRSLLMAILTWSKILNMGIAILIS